MLLIDTDIIKTRIQFFHLALDPDKQSDHQDPRRAKDDGHQVYNLSHG